MVTEQQLEEVANHSQIFEIEDDYLEPEFRERCEEIIPHPERIVPENCVNSFLYLKDNMPESYLASALTQNNI
jgi:hypothetical protein